MGGEEERDGKEGLTIVLVLGSSNVDLLDKVGHSDNGFSAKRSLKGSDLESVLDAVVKVSKHSSVVVVSVRGCRRVDGRGLSGRRVLERGFVSLSQPVEDETLD